MIKTLYAEANNSYIYCFLEVIMNQFLCLWKTIFPLFQWMVLPYTSVLGALMWQWLGLLLSFQLGERLFLLLHDQCRITTCGTHFLYFSPLRSIVVEGVLGKNFKLIVGMEVLVSSGCWVLCKGKVVLSTKQGSSVVSWGSSCGSVSLNLAPG